MTDKIQMLTVYSNNLTKALMDTHKAHNQTTLVLWTLVEKMGGSVEIDMGDIKARKNEEVGAEEKDGVLRLWLKEVK